MAKADEEITEKTDEEMQESVADALDDVLGGEPSVLDGEHSALGGEPSEKEEGGNNEQAPGENGEEAGEGEAGEEGEEGEGVEGQAEGEGDAEEAGAPDYSVPEGLNERSQERFRQLVEDNKAVREEVQKATETITGMRQMVIDSGLSNQEFLGAIDFAATVKRDPAKGIEMLQDYIKHVAKTTGIKPKGMEVDLLDDFPDLQTAVEDMEMTEAAALEIAQSRRQKAQQERAQQQQADPNSEQGYKAAQDAAIPELTKILTTASKSIDWDAKSPAILEAAQFARENLHPSKWVGYIQGEIKKIDALSKRVGGRRGGKSPQPLTGGDGHRGGKKEPQTIEEGIDSILT
jgi:hypothetical protein